MLVGGYTYDNALPDNKFPYRICTYLPLNYPYHEVLSRVLFLSLFATFLVTPHIISKIFLQGGRSGKSSAWCRRSPDQERQLPFSHMVTHLPLYFHLKTQGACCLRRTIIGGWLSRI